MRNTILGDGISKRHRNVLLANEIGKSLWTPFSGKDDVGQRLMGETFSFVPKEKVSPIPPSKRKVMNMKGFLRLEANDAHDFLYKRICSQLTLLTILNAECGIV